MNLTYQPIPSLFPTAISLVALILSLSPVPAKEVALLDDHPAVELAEEIALSEDNSTLTINATDELKVPIFVLRKPKVAETGYILKGEVRHEDVGGGGMLEMWNFFPAVDADGNLVEGREGYFFSRTAGDYGPMGKLNGTSAWRPFILPFNPGDLGHPPKRLEVNALLPDGGTVMLRNLELVDWQPPAGREADKTGRRGWWILPVTLLLIAAGAILSVFFRRQRNVEKELRRIAAADTQG